MFTIVIPVEDLTANGMFKSRQVFTLHLNDKGADTENTH